MARLAGRILHMGRRSLCRCLGALAICCCATATATNYIAANRTVNVLGVVSWGTYRGFVSFVEPLPTPPDGPALACTYNIMYFDETQVVSKYWYNTLLAAKLTGAHVYIDYNQDSYGTCYVIGVRITG